MTLGGDVNCVLEKSDTTGHYHYNRALAELVHGLATPGNKPRQGRLIHIIHRPEQREYTAYMLLKI